MKKCSSCGMQVFDDSARFCTECGKPLIDVAPEPSVQESPGTTGNTGFVSEAGPSESAPETVQTQADIPAETPAASPVMPAVPFGMGDAPAAPQPPAYQQTFGYSAQTPYQQPPVNNIVAMLDRNVEQASKALASPWFVIAAVSYLLFAIASIANVFYTYTGNNYLKVLDQYGELFDQLGINPYDLLGSMDQYKSSAVVTSVILLIPMIISAVGLIIMISYGNKKPTPTAGITMAKTQAVFRIVCSSIAILGSICISIAVIILAAGAKQETSSFGSYGFYGVASGAMAGVLVFIMILFIIVFVLMLLYYAGLVKTLTTLKRAGSEGKCPKNRVSIYAAVIHIIASVYLMIMFIIDLISLGDSGSLFSLANNGLGMLFYFTSAIAMFKLRDALVVIPEVK
ncbi:MAG: zinc-ribbon domain-containing protein [Lachnospiraceae bacterium]|nr:zinc-ribbon domain-containing protein [Lachnospiraceae bacterium]